jgi:hypothetical protein
MFCKRLVITALVLVSVAAVAAAQGPATIAGQWEGQWVNSDGREGYDSLDVFEDRFGRIYGTWGTSGYNLEGERVGRGLYTWRASGKGRSYEATARLRGGGQTMTVDYEATSRDRGGWRRYRGHSTLRRVGF